MVQKFGGSSLASPEKIARVAARIAAERAKGRPLVVVASAMGGRTDALVQLASALSDTPPPRELDALLATGESASTALLAMALEELGVPAVSLRGWRSDTTAVAIAAALGVPCEIYSDVPGVFSADPRHVQGARLVPCLRYDEMLAYAERGAKVLNEDAVATARELGVPLHARATFADVEGTLVTTDVPRASIVGVAMRRETYRISGSSDAVDAICRVHHGVQRREVAEPAPFAETQFDRGPHDAQPSNRPTRHEALVVLCEGATPDGLEGVVVDGPFATVSVVGARAPKLQNAIDAALEGAGIACREQWIDATSATCVLSPRDAIAALCALHQALVEGRAVTHAPEGARA
ncbi:MAG: hypothetical protein MUE69_33220 [Myxococcota bacterium]|nr:hypothetical protein [Myxococcota bacterium]